MDNNLVAIGDRLRKSREGRSLTIDQVQKHTRIHADVLKSLEDGTCDGALSATYVKSFLRKYSGYLGLDANEIIKQYCLSLPEKVVEVQPVVNRIEIRTGESDERPSNLVPKLIVAAVSAAALVAMFLLVSFVGKVVASSFNRHKVSAPARQAPTRQPKAPLRKKIVTSKEITSNYLGSKGMLIFLVLKTKQPVLIKVSKDGVSQFERVMPKGVIETIKASEKIELYIAKAEAVELVLNGKSLGSPGRGLIKNLEITTKGIRIK